jgi:hypothetical protein
LSSLAEKAAREPNADIGKCPILQARGDILAYPRTPAKSLFERTFGGLDEAAGFHCWRKAAIVLSVPVRAEQSAEWPIIGFLGAASPELAGPWVAAFVKRLGELGWTEGRNVAIEYRWAEARTERYSEIATELANQFDPKAFLAKVGAGKVDLQIRQRSERVRAGRCRGRGILHLKRKDQAHGRF